MPIKFKEEEYTVTAVITDQYRNTDIYFDAILSLSDNDLDDNYWTTSFLLLQDEDQDQHTEVHHQLNKLFEDHLAGDYYTDGIELSCELVSLEKLHFEQPKLYDRKKGSKSVLYIFIIFALFILLIASFNYLNISAAQFVKRNKEVFVRKVLGSTKRMLTFQFLAESFVIIFMAAIIGMLICFMVLPSFNLLSGKDFAASHFISQNIVTQVLALLIFLNLLNAIVPAMYLKQMNSKSLVYKGNKLKDHRVFQSSLIFAQVTLSMILIIGAFVVKDQAQFISNHSLGFDKEKTVSLLIPNDNYVISHLSVFTEALKSQIPVQTAVTNRNFATGDETDLDVFYIEYEDNFVNQTLNNIKVDENFFPMLNIPFIAGKNFSPLDGIPAFIVNRKFVEVMQWKKPLGKKIKDGNGVEGSVIGVVENFHIKSMHKQIEPLIIGYTESGNGMLVKFATDNNEVLSEVIYNAWENFFEGYTLEVLFLEDIISRQYEKETQTQTLLSIFALLSVVLSAIGIFGLSLFLLQNKIKEVSLRKILGADHKQIIYATTKNIVKVSMSAIAFATPIAWLVLKNWLNNFAYRGRH